MMEDIILDDVGEDNGREAEREKGAKGENFWKG